MGFFAKKIDIFPSCSNTFVLEYCGEVLDHKEFKARVKEYARNKNIHYYFMALKNDEVSSGIAGMGLPWERLDLAVYSTSSLGTHGETSWIHWECFPEESKLQTSGFFNPLLSSNKILAA